LSTLVISTSLNHRTIIYGGNPIIGNIPKTHEISMSKRYNALAH
jgi:hypothetical protein